MEIEDSAHRHGVTDTDMLHAFRNPIAVHLMVGYRMFVGPATTGALLEVAVSDEDVIFHAMPARPKYLRH